MRLIDQSVFMGKFVKTRSGNFLRKDGRNNWHTLASRPLCGVLPLRFVMKLGEGVGWKFDWNRLVAKATPSGF